MIQTQCDGCFRDYNLDDKYAGKTIRCKDCGKAFKVLAAGSEPAEVELDEPPARSRASAPCAATGRKPSGKSSRRSSSGSKAWIWWLVGGAALAVLLVCGGGVVAFLSGVKKAFVTASTPDVPLGDPDQLFPIADVPLPQFPDLGAPQSVESSNVQLYFVDFGTAPGNSDQPGMRMKMRIYMPPGDHEAGSLGCVLVAPAGTNLLTGNDMDSNGYHDETLPYAEAGMVVVFYSIDGGLPDGQEDNGQLMRDAYLKFREARAGVINGRNALEYVVAMVPQVDPRRIYCPGHSSAATLSLLLSAHEPRLRGCLAYAPATEVESRLAELTETPGINVLFPGITDFLRQSSPTTHVARVNCPVFLFHARDDSNVPFATTEAFAGLLQSNGKAHTFSIAESGNHYASMIDEGIPRGIEWIRSVPAESQ